MKRGSVTERPWGTTLAELVKERATGELVVIAEGKRYAIAFQRGAVTSALSPAVADSIGRIALTSHLVSSTQVAEITRRIAASPERDEIDVIAEVARLSPSQADALRRRVITQRAARTFAIEQGTFAFDDKVPVPDLRGGAIDARTVIYIGARMHLSQTRLTTDLRALGSRFVLRLDATEELARFGFTDVERPVLAALRSGTSLADLEATYRELDPRMLAAVIYAVATYGACGDVKKVRSITRDEIATQRTVTPMRLVNQRVSTRERDAVLPLPPPPDPGPPPTPIAPATLRLRSTTPPAGTPVTIPIPLAISRTMTPQPAISRTMTPPPLATGSSPMLRRPSVQIPPLSVEPEPPPPVVVRTPTRDLDARDAFQRGEMAMRREQIPLALSEFGRAAELAPDDPDYAATFAWAKFCAAADKQAIADDTRRQIDKAITRATTSVTARMCLGRVERMLGRDKEALRSFQQVLEIQPRHSAAASEARVLEARLGARR